MKLIQCRRTAYCIALVLTVCAMHVVAQTQPPVDSVPATPPSESKQLDAADELAKTSSVALSGDSAKTISVDNSMSVREISETNAPQTNIKNEASPMIIPNLQGAATDEWQFQLTPYLWIAGISGRGGIGPLVVDADSGITDPNVHLNFGFMGTFEARKNRLIFLTDLQYSNLGTDRPTPGPLFGSATADFKTFILDPEIGYRVAENPDKGRFIDLLGGIRYWHLRTDLNFSAGLLPATSATASRDWVDAVVGMRGKMHLSPRVFLTGKADLGGGGSKFTFQLLGGVGVQVSKRVALIGGYRHLDVNYNRDGFLFDMALHGPILGFGIKL